MCTLYREFNSLTGEENDQSMPEQIKRFEELCTQIEKAANEASTICLGDMNINLNKWNEDDFYLKKLAENIRHAWVPTDLKCSILVIRGTELIKMVPTRSLLLTIVSGTNQKSHIDAL